MVLVNESDANPRRLFLRFHVKKLFLISNFRQNENITITTEAF